MKDKLHDETMAEHFRANPTYAEKLLAEIRRDGDPAELAILLLQMVTAFGQDAGWSLADAERKLSFR